MKFLTILGFWVALTAVLAAGVAMAAHGKPWLLLLGGGVFVAGFIKIGCLDNH